MNSRTQTRREDMSQHGKLTLIIQSDGDAIVSVTQDDGRMADVEFCTPGAGGGGSSRTWNALRALFAAMQEDNDDPRQVHRSPSTVSAKHE